MESLINDIRGREWSGDSAPKKCRQTNKQTTKTIQATEPEKKEKKHEDKKYIYGLEASSAHRGSTHSARHHAGLGWQWQ